jgi:hypothetical protein
MLNIAYLTINELERIGEKAPMPNLRYHSDIYLKVMNKTTKNLTQFPSRDFNRGSPEYKPEMLYLSRRIPFMLIVTRRRHVNPVYNLSPILLRFILILSHHFA